jgi:hypothetical protein
MTDTSALFEIVDAAKKLAREYYVLTGRPLGITGEVAEVEAVRALGLELAEVRQAGYDAIRRNPDGTVVRLQVKGRCCPPGSNPGQRVGSIQLDKEWDAVLLVLLTENLELSEIFEAPRAAVTAALLRPGSAARNERGALGVNAFKRIAAQVWPTEPVPRSQDRQSGAAGNQFGHTIAPKIAAAIGATMLGPGTNEATWDARRIVIKCAGPQTSAVGVTHTMLARLDSVVAAFQRPQGEFEIFEMRPDVFASQMRGSRSSGSAGRVGLVSRQTFRTHGTHVKTIAVDWAVTLVQPGLLATNDPN